jgi:hypothetical protein
LTLRFHNIPLHPKQFYQMRRVLIHLDTPTQLCQCQVFGFSIFVEEKWTSGLIGCFQRPKPRAFWKMCIVRRDLCTGDHHVTCCVVQKISFQSMKLLKHTHGCDMMWYDVIWCDMMWYDVMNIYRKCMT